MSYSSEWLLTSSINAHSSKFSSKINAIELIPADFFGKNMEELVDKMAGMWKRPGILYYDIIMFKIASDIGCVHHVLCGYNSIALHASHALRCASHPVWTEGKVHPLCTSADPTRMRSGLFQQTPSPCSDSRVWLWLCWVWRRYSTVQSASNRAFGQWTLLLLLTRIPERVVPRSGESRNTENNSLLCFIEWCVFNSGADVKTWCAQIQTFFLWCCLRAVWTPPFTSTGPICLRPASCVDWAEKLHDGADFQFVEKHAHLHARDQIQSSVSGLSLLRRPFVQKECNFLWWTPASWQDSLPVIEVSERAKTACLSTTKPHHPTVIPFSSLDHKEAPWVVAFELSKIKRVLSLLYIPWHSRQCVLHMESPINWRLTKWKKSVRPNKWDSCERIRPVFIWVKAESTAVLRCVDL